MKTFFSEYFGYMTEREALHFGMSWHGSYYGIPIWISDDAVPMIAAKWAPMEYAISFFHVIEGMVRSVCFPDQEPGFTFKMVKRRELPKATGEEEK